MDSMKKPPTLKTLAQELALFQIQVLEKLKLINEAFRLQEKITKADGKIMGRLLVRVIELEKAMDAQIKFNEETTKIEDLRQQPKPPFFAKWFKREK